MREVILLKTSAKDVLKLINEFPRNTASASNDIAASILKVSISGYFKKPTNIFNKCIRKGTFPEILKDPLLGLRRSVRSIFYFILKTLFVLAIYICCLCFLVMQKNSLIRRLWKINSKMYDVTERTANNYITYIFQYLKKQRQSGN